MMPKQINLLRQIGVVVVVIATIVVNILSQALPFNGVTMAELTARFDVLMVPAGYAFYIWWLIYAGLLAYAIYQAQPSLRDDARLRSLDRPFLLSSLANMTWLLLWHYQHYMATFVVMLVLVGSLVAIYRRLDVDRETAVPAKRWTVLHVFSLYLGWVTLAAIANLGTVLDYLGWTGWGLGESTWFMIGLLTIIAIAGLLTWLRRDLVFLLPLLWGVIGIGVERADQPMISTLAWVATAVLAVMVAMTAIEPTPDRRRALP